MHLSRTLIINFFAFITQLGETQGESKSSWMGPEEKGVIAQQEAGVDLHQVLTTFRPLLLTLCPTYFTMHVVCGRLSFKLLRQAINNFRMSMLQEGAAILPSRNRTVSLCSSGCLHMLQPCHQTTQTASRIKQELTCPQ